MRAALALVLLAALTAGLAKPCSAETPPPCDRASFGNWTQSHYRTTRVNVLERYAITPAVEFAPPHKLVKVLQGTWIDPYTGKVYQNAEADSFQIDHVVPICWAWAHGAWSWDQETKRQFYNDIDFLRPVPAHENLSKGDKGPLDWQPVDRKSACIYLGLFQLAAERYSLDLSKAEATALEQERDSSCTLTPSGA